jgi:hypothetical protein
MNNRPRFDNRRRARPRVEGLEDRRLLSWMTVPPAHIAPQVNSPPSTYVYPVALSTQDDAHPIVDAQGSNRNVGGEVDFYRFTTPLAGTYQFDATSPGHAVDTVIAVYDASGNRLGYNDDMAQGNRDSETSVTLQANNQYYFGVTNYIANTTHGSYNWRIHGDALLVDQVGPEAPGDSTQKLYYVDQNPDTSGDEFYALVIETPTDAGVRSRFIAKCPYTGGDNTWRTIRDPLTHDVTQVEWESIDKGLPDDDGDGDIDAMTYTYYVGIDSLDITNSETDPATGDTTVNEAQSTSGIQPHSGYGFTFADLAPVNPMDPALG